MDYLPRSHYTLLRSFAGEELYPDYWNDLSIALCPSDSRADGTGEHVYGIEEDWQKQVADVAATAGNATEEDYAAACRNALISMPVSYIYMAWAVENMLQFADCSYSTISQYWYDADYQKYLAEHGTEYGSAATLTKVGCPDWSMQATLGTALNPPLAYHPYGPLRDSLPSRVTDPNADDKPYLQDSYQGIREGVERFFITDINNPASGSTGQSTLPVMWDAWGSNYAVTDSDHFQFEHDGVVRTNHVPGGSNVMYMDGHVEFVRYNSEFPISSLSERTGESDAFIESCALRAGGYG
jgi:prepilin-type processing-associated H-X9-DG protein